MGLNRVGHQPVGLPVNLDDRVDLNDIAARLGVAATEADRVHRLAGDHPSAPLPAQSDAPALLDRLGGRPEDAVETVAAWPTPTLHSGPRSYAGCSTALIRADLGGYAWLPPGLALPRDRGPAWKHLYVYGYLALVDVVLAYYRDSWLHDPQQGLRPRTSPVR